MKLKSAEAPALRKPRAPRGRVLRHLMTDRAAAAAAAFLLVLALVALFAPWIATHDPDRQNLALQLQGPSGDHWLGTDNFGRDLFSRLVSSTRVTLLAVLEALVLASVLGVPLGLLAGYAGGAVDAVLSRVSDAILALPPLILAIAIVGILGPGLTNAMLALGIVLAPPQFRLARGAAQSVSSETYIEACRSLGCSPWRILWRHVLPNAGSPLLVQISFAAGVIVIAEASLSFLGLGVQAPQSSWGTLLRDAFDHIYDSPYSLAAPTVMVALTILSFSTLGDALRDALEGQGGGRSRSDQEKS
ncbi:peptide/nickel transport system permease protein [Actinocorallia herbida]|uniref:Peptide/nickel transport system permease protein n=1 Tax=Actinocorallia herbida TaxID=58109 RepID=A0A3N1D1R3_9ACTN|nr:ABC transporter permease [Actinocorallia herbida]ROO87469.1 peptide/nickel transport system permease protein [Actinocorallia herbida]